MSTIRGPARLADLQGTLWVPARYPYNMASSTGHDSAREIILGFQSIAQYPYSRVFRKGFSGVVLRWWCPKFLFVEVAGFEASSRPYLLKHGLACHPEVIVRLSFAKKKAHMKITSSKNPSSRQEAIKRSLNNNHWL